MRRPDAGTWLWRAGGCFLLAAGVSFARTALTDSLAVQKAGLAAWLGTFLLLGVPLTAACFCLLHVLQLAPTTPWRRLAIGVVALHLLAFPALPLTSNDLFSNLAYGQMAQRGLDPDRTGPSALGDTDPFGRLVSPRWRDTPSVYGPLCLAVARWAAGPGSVVEAAIRFKLAMLAATLAIVAVAFGLGRRFPEPEGKRRAMLLAASPLLVWDLTAQAHNDALMVLGLALTAWAVMAERPWIALGCALVAVLAKAAALPVALLLGVALLRTPRTRWWLLGLGAAATAMVVGRFPGAIAAALRAPLAASGALDPDRHTRSIADVILSALEPLGASVQHAVYWPLWAAHVLAVALAFTWAAWRTRTLRQALHGAVVTLGLYLWSTPWSQPWYGTWLLPLLAVEEEGALRRVGVAYTFLLVVQYALAFDPVPYLVVIGLPLWMLWRERVGRPTSLS